MKSRRIIVLLIAGCILLAIGVWQWIIHSDFYNDAKDHEAFVELCSKFALANYEVSDVYVSSPDFYYRPVEEHVAIIDIDFEYADIDSSLKESKLKYKPEGWYIVHIAGIKGFRVQFRTDDMDLYYVFYNNRKFFIKSEMLSNWVRAACDDMDKRVYD